LRDVEVTDPPLHDQRSGPVRHGLLRMVMTIVRSTWDRAVEEALAHIRARVNSVIHLNVDTPQGRVVEAIDDVGETRGHEVPPTIGGRGIPGSAAEGD
jgi:hypothetical protein